MFYKYILDCRQRGDTTMTRYELAVPSGAGCYYELADDDSHMARLWSRATLQPRDL